MTRIVVGIDGSVGSERALRWAVNEAARRHAPVVAVLAWGGADDGATTEVERRAAAAGTADAGLKIDQFVLKALGDAGGGVERSARRGQPAEVLLGAAVGASMLVVGSRGRGGFASLLLGSVSVQCITHGTCPVVVVPGEHTPTPQTTPQRVVVGVDGSAGGRDALQWAVTEAAFAGASLEVVHVWDMPMAGAYTYATPVFDWGPFEAAANTVLDGDVDSVDCSGLASPPERILATGGAAHAILEAAKEGDLIVLGSRGRGGFAGLLLGSVGQRVAHHAMCPVVIVPST